MWCHLIQHNVIKHFPFSSLVFYIASPCHYLYGRWKCAHVKFMFACLACVVFLIPKPILRVLFISFENKIWILRWRRCLPKNIKMLRSFRYYSADPKMYFYGMMVALRSFKTSESFICLKQISQGFFYVSILSTELEI